MVNLVRHDERENRCCRSSGADFGVCEELAPLLNPVNVRNPDVSLTAHLAKGDLVGNLINAEPCIQHRRLFAVGFCRGFEFCEELSHDLRVQTAFGDTRDGLFRDESFGHHRADRCYPLVVGTKHCGIRFLAVPDRLKERAVTAFLGKPAVSVRQIVSCLLQIGKNHGVGWKRAAVVAAQFLFEALEVSGEEFAYDILLRVLHELGVQAGRVSVENLRREDAKNLLACLGELLHAGD